MRTWILLAVAIGCEVAGSLSLKVALDVPAWYTLTATGYLVSLVLLSLVLRTGMSIGVVYGIWGALGVALTAALAAGIFDELLTVVMVIGMVLVIVGVLVVELGRQQAEERAKAAEQAKVVR